jgi:hypothetical protein
MPEKINNGQIRISKMTKQMAFIILERQILPKNFFRLLKLIFLAQYKTNINGYSAY